MQNISFSKKILPGIVLITLSLMATTNVLAADLHVYGPGGPAPVVKELAKLYEAKTGKQIKVVAGPPANWQAQAQQDADVFFSGASIMMNDFAKKFPGKIDLDDVDELNVREAGILVRPDNPKKIKSFADLLKDDVNVMVVDGSGQLSLWEDMVLKTGDIKKLEKLRDNIKVYADNSGEAIKRWSSDSNIDAIVIWKHWQNADSKFVEAGKDYVIYRAAEVVIAKDSKNKELADDFIDFMQSSDIQKIWKKKGWIANK